MIVDVYSKTLRKTALMCARDSENAKAKAGGLAADAARQEGMPAAIIRRT